MEITLTSIIGLVNLILIILVAINNHLNHIKLTTNDLKHLVEDVKTIISRQEGISNKVLELATDLAYVKGMFDVRTSKTFKKSKKILNKV
jgi:hypothetical protein